MVATLSPSSDPMSDLVLNELDHTRLNSLLDRQAPATRHAAALHALMQMLTLADTAPPQQMAPDVITMRSRVTLTLPTQTGGHASRTVSLIYPGDADVHGDGVSVLSPLGASLLGAKVGQTINWQGPTGEAHEAVITTLMYQPEAAGDYRL